MKITSSTKKYTNTHLYDCHMYVRKDLTVIEATEPYYLYVGDNSYLPISDLLYEEDGELLRQAAQEETVVELITGITNRKEGYRTIYLRMEPSERTEMGKPIYWITFYEIRSMEQRNIFLEQHVDKYRRFMSLSGQYYFEYTVNNNYIVIYKYINDKALQVIGKDLEQFEQECLCKEHQSDTRKEQIRNFCQYLRCRAASFDVEFTEDEEGKKVCCRVKGGVMKKDKNLVVGVMTPDQMTVQEAYYLTPAARDSGTGLLNKRASAQYASERLQLQDRKRRWFIMIDVDDFKTINDKFGHLFGDEVIRKVAEVLQSTLGARGIVGRFGGDEFFMLLEDVASREEVKNLLKTVVKHLYYVYDPKYKITCSIGISQYPQDGCSYEELLGKADKALYIAKEKGKNRHIIYDEKVHGSLDNDNRRMNEAAFSMSKEKRRAAIIDCVTQLYAKGISYLEEARVPDRLRQVFDLDGITIFADGGGNVLCRCGNYVDEIPDITVALQDEKYTELFDGSGVLVESNMLKLKAEHPQAYEAAVKQEVGATIQCMGKRDGQPYSLITFDIFNRNRKWADADVEMMSLIGNCINQLLCGKKE